MTIRGMYKLPSTLVWGRKRPMSILPTRVKMGNGLSSGITVEASVHARLQKEVTVIIRVEDTVRVLVPGKFQGQIVKVLNKKERMHDIDYQLDTKWADKPYPGW